MVLCCPVRCEIVLCCTVRCYVQHTHTHTHTHTSPFPFLFLLHLILLFIVLPFYLFLPSSNASVSLGDWCEIMESMGIAAKAYEQDIWKEEDTE